ncbi:MAG: hypothetical protein H6672_16810 [Anaerolineaceae bacterium]|nr:hypothetical protein [Anaerolineaceae bacterium]
MKRKKSDLYTERQTVSLTPEQMRRLKELRSVRARRDGRLIHLTDLIRDAINYYLAAQEDLPGSRRAIAKGVEVKIETLEAKVDTLTTTLNNFIERVTRRRGS